MLIGFSAPASAQFGELPDFTRIAEQHGAAVVNISTTQRARVAAPMPQWDENDPFHEFFRRFMPRPQRPQEFESRSLGSGFIIGADGYILTNAHVVSAADEITVKLPDKREFKATVVGADRRTDIALLHVNAKNLPVVRLGDPDKLKPGEWVVAIGSPFGFDNSVTAGIVSAKGRSLPQENFVPFIQTDVAINPGNSGGPLFNLRGEVVGINSQIYSRTGGFMGLSFAIPIDVAMDVQAQLRAHGRVHRGRIGVVIQEVSKELAESFGLSRVGGALVNAVERDGPAHRAGVQPGDIILSFGGKPVQSSTDLPRIVASTPPGSRTKMQVWRQGARQELALTVGETPDENAGVGAQRRAQKKSAVPNRLGLVLAPLSPERQGALGIQGGVLVADVQGNAAADVRPGDVVLALIARGQTHEIRTVEQFNSLLAKFDRQTALTLHLRRGEHNIFTILKGNAVGR